MELLDISLSIAVASSNSFSSHCNLSVGLSWRLAMKWAARNRSKSFVDSCHARMKSSRASSILSCSSMAIPCRQSFTIWLFGLNSMISALSNRNYQFFGISGVPTRTILHLKVYFNYFLSLQFLHMRRYDAKNLFLQCLNDLCFDIITMRDETNFPGGARLFQRADKFHLCLVKFNHS